MINNITRANVLNEALPYIQEYSGKIVVVKYGGAAMIDEKLKQAVSLRIDNPELSIKELAEISIPPVTKSCMNHRMRRIAELAGK